MTVKWQNYSGRRCVICGSPSGLEHGHVVDKSEGGSDAPENILPMCFDCNRALTPPHASRDEFMIWNRNYPVVHLMMRLARACDIRGVDILKTCPGYEELFSQFGNLALADMRDIDDGPGGPLYDTPTHADWDRMIIQSYVQQETA